jgi:hypothetical protein
MQTLEDIHDAIFTNMKTLLNAAYYAGRASALTEIITEARKICTPHESGCENHLLFTLEDAAGKALEKSFTAAAPCGDLPDSDRPE